MGGLRANKIAALFPDADIVAVEPPVAPAVASMPSAKAIEQKDEFAASARSVIVGAVATASKDHVEPEANAAKAAITMALFVAVVTVVVPVVGEVLERAEGATSG